MEYQFRRHCLRKDIGRVVQEVMNYHGESIISLRVVKGGFKDGILYWQVTGFSRRKDCLIL